MNKKSFSFVIVLLLIAFAVIGVSGCGGSSSSPLNSTNENSGDGEGESTVLESYDSDEDGTPDILDFDDFEELDYGKDEVIQDKKISVPSRHYLKRLSTFDSPDSFVVDLTAETEYTVEISRGDHYDFPIGNNIPNVDIFNPQGNALSLDVEDEDEESDSLNDDTIELSVYPPDDPYMICLTFTPSVTGRYTIELSQIVSTDNIYGDMTIFVYEERRNESTGEAGYYKRYKFSDTDGNLSATISMTDIMALRKTLNEVANSIIETRIISGDEESILENTISQVQDYLDTVRLIKQHYGIFDDYIESEKYEDINSYTSSLADPDSEVIISAGNPNGTKIPAELYGINYEDKFDLGIGFTAITGAPAQGRAVKKSTIKKGIEVPKNKRVKSLYKASFVSSQADAEKVSTTTVDAKVQLGGFGFSAGNSSSTSFKFGLTSTTFVIHYEETEAQYRMLDDDEDYQLNSNGIEMLAYGSKAFREEFGDYFVGGYQYGGTYDAIITISTKTSEQLEKVKSHLSASFTSEEKAASADVANESKNFLKNNEATIGIEIRTAGINDDGGFEVTKNGDLASLATSLMQFKEKLKKTSPDDFQPVYVMLKRYRLLPAVLARMKKDGDNGLIPIPSEHSTKVMNFKRDMVTMHAYYNVINDSNYMAMDQEVKNAYGRRYDKIKNTVAAQSDTVFDVSNAAQLEQLHNDMLQLNKELKTIADRYVFYQLLMAAQDQEKKSNADTTSVLNRPYGPGGGSIGYTSFMSSKAVNADIQSGKSDESEINQFSGSEWTPTFDAGNGYLFCYIKVTANNVKDNERKANCPCIATQKPSFFFKCGGSRWLEWKIELKSMRFTQDRYPFTGLKQ